ncbi:UbiX family flavin prenyltransferase [Arcobacter sp. FWKO B]|uniref:UbiX family flavin prenyltransferase n=1 Tax=Arcobacter sp. FWKO B TaxID=2593672 RepID=UPI0018A65F99|nr:UbiX family flavin prenyltransferase [Arcobacter sp. FWKO B]QOG13142.1 UbiX family flavin prenyltransferase [Arcobacter sp. FWKO B]
MKLTVGITGASGVELGIKFISLLPKEITPYIVLSNSAKVALKHETNKDVQELYNHTVYEDDNIGAPIASGSFGCDAMIILPCSMNTLAKCSVGISDTLITRAFSVMLKEKKRIVLAPRELPFSSIALENMLKLSNYGVVIAPPILGYYSNQQTLNDMEDFLIGKWFDLLDINNNLYKRWQGGIDLP